MPRPLFRNIEGQDHVKMQHNIKPASGIAWNDPVSAARLYTDLIKKNKNKWGSFKSSSLDILRQADVWMTSLLYMFRLGFGVIQGLR